MRSLDSFHDYNTPSEWKKYVGESTEIHDAASKEFWNKQAPLLLSNKLLGVHAMNLKNAPQQLLAIERCRHLLQLSPRKKLQTVRSEKITVRSGDSLSNICKRIIQQIGSYRPAADALLMCIYLSHAGCKVDQLKKGDVIQLNPRGKSGGYLQIIDAQSGKDIGDYCIYGSNKFGGQKVRPKKKKVVHVKTQPKKKPPVKKEPPKVKPKPKAQIKKRVVKKVPKTSVKKPKQTIKITIPPKPVKTPKPTTKPVAPPKPTMIAQPKPAPKPQKKVEKLSPKEKAKKRAEKEAKDAMKVLRGPKMQRIIENLKKSKFNCHISFEKRKAPNGFPVIEAKMSLNYNAVIKTIKFSNRRAAIAHFSGNGKTNIDFWNPLKQKKQKTEQYELKTLMQNPQKILLDNLKNMRKKYWRIDPRRGVISDLIEIIEKS